MNIENNSMSNAEKKVQEYVDRISNGESKESVMQGLSPAFVSGIESGLAAAVEKQRRIDETRLAEIRGGLKSEHIQAAGSDPASNGVEHQAGKQSLSELVAKVSQGRSQLVIDLYKGLLANSDNPETRNKLASGLFQDVYNRYRRADYPVDPQEESVWNKYLGDDSIGVDNHKKDWMYRGVFPKKGEETVTRGSFNVRVEPGLIDALDGMIRSGRIKANYKFGQPGTPASPNDRHDSISIYFLEQPSNDVLDELSALVKPYVRGDNLLGHKIADGFFMSEIGSIESEHIDRLVGEMNSRDAGLAAAVKFYTSPIPGQGTRLQMSEAQFYAIKDVVGAFGYRLSYDKDKGFSIE